jgi:hypothetical protein
MTIFKRAAIQGVGNERDSRLLPQPFRLFKFPATPYVRWLVGRVDVHAHRRGPDDLAELHGHPAGTRLLHPQAPQPARSAHLQTLRRLYSCLRHDAPARRACLLYAHVPPGRGCQNWLRAGERCDRVRVDPRHPPIACAPFARRTGTRNQRSKTGRGKTARAEPDAGTACQRTQNWKSKPRN